MTGEPANKALGRLVDGPLDVVGDVHGEIDALSELLGHLGYDARGVHPDGRHLVFVGDLCDRGPDSPAVLDMVLGLVEAGRAQCVLGNHEINALLNAPKHGNGWFFDRDHERAAGEFLHSKAATPERRTAWLRWLNRTPLALEREDLRVVHACWSNEAIVAVGLAIEDVSYAEAHEAFHALTKAMLRRSGVDKAAAKELQSHRHALWRRDARVPLLPAYAEQAKTQQNENPVKVLTSGLEWPADSPVWAGGRWRMTHRSRWWKEYVERVPVIVGHYWRRDARAEPQEVTGDWDYPLGDYEPYSWMGPRRNVFCVDYSVGGRYLERSRGRTSPPFQTRLAAMRWPERVLVFDDGERRATSD